MPLTAMPSKDRIEKDKRASSCCHDSQCNNRSNRQHPNHSQCDPLQRLQGNPGFLSIDAMCGGVDSASAYLKLYAFKFPALLGLLSATYFDRAYVAASYRRIFGAYLRIREWHYGT